MPAKKLVVSNGVQYYGSGLKKADKSLSTSYIETNIKIGIHSVLPENMQTTTSKYDYKSGVEINLKGKTAKTLAKVVKKITKAIYAGEEDISPLGVTSGSNMIEVSDGHKFNLPKGLTITIYSDIGADKKTEIFDVFQFNTNKVIKDYNMSEGTYEDFLLDTDIEYFVDQLDEFSIKSSNASAHIYTVRSAFDMNRMSSRMLQVMDKLGIQAQPNGFSAGSSWVNKSVSQASHGDSDMSTDDLFSELDNM